MNRHLAVCLLVLGLLAGCSSGPSRAPSTGIGNRAAETALTMVGKPYRYGGNSPRGFDCSGLVYYSYNRAGAAVPRSTELLWKYSDTVSTGSLRRGDLLFFHQEGKRNSHVAIYIGGSRFVHAPSSGKYVRTGTLEDPYWRRHFAGARRPNVY